MGSSSSCPSHNHSFPGLLKHVLDSNLKEYIHKAVGVCGVSAGPFGGARMIQNLLPVLRELGLVMIFTDVYFGAAGKLFDPATGDIIDPAYARRLKAFVDELVWMARVLRCGRENLPASLTSHEGCISRFALRTKVVAWHPCGRAVVRIHRISDTRRDFTAILATR